MRKKLDKRIPNHVAIMMAGTKRWADVSNISECDGFRRGAEALANVAVAAHKFGICYLTAYDLELGSPSSSISAPGKPWGFLRAFIENHKEVLRTNGINVRVLGSGEGRGADRRHLFENAETDTIRNPGLQLCLMQEFSGRQEILRAVQKIAEESRNGTIDPVSLDVGRFRDFLDTRALSDPDLLLCTGGVTRPMGSLTWGIAYSEFVFFDTLWPDFSVSDFDNALTEFNRRQRRFGDIKEAN